MTYIELINRFWEAYRVKKFSDIDTTVYFFLLNECNIRIWLNPFELQTRNLEVTLQIARKTIGEARNRLKQRGMINFREAKGRGPTIYLIEGVDVKNEVLYERFCVTVEKHEGNTNGNTKVTQRLHNGNATPIFTLLNEDERLKTKDDVARACEDEKFLDDFFSDNVTIEAFCMNNSISVADMRRLATEIMVEWKLAGKTHESTIDARHHLISTVRIKLKEIRQNGSTKPTGSGYEQRQAEIARLVATKLSTPDYEPDISGDY